MWGLHLQTEKPRAPGDNSGDGASAASEPRSAAWSPESRPGSPESGRGRVEGGTHCFQCRKPCPAQDLPNQPSPSASSQESLTLLPAVGRRNRRESMMEVSDLESHGLLQ